MDRGHTDDGMKAKPKAEPAPRVGRIIDGRWVYVGDEIRIAGTRGTWIVRGFCESKLTHDGERVWCVDVYQNKVRTFPETKVRKK